MRRYPSAAAAAAAVPPMASKLKPYDMVGRPSIHSYAPSSLNNASSKSRLTKFVAALVIAAMSLYLLHGLIFASDTVYGLMIDAGSTGSRIHTYRFSKTTGNKLRVLSEDFHALKPGLSANKNNPSAAADSLKPLLDHARSQIPSALHKSTPVVLRATAGLRMVGEETAADILNKVREILKESPFRFDSDQWASILSGNEEGIYSWMTVNYLMNRPPGNTVGTLEMGGGSAQVAYVPRTDLSTTGACNVSSEPLAFNGEKLQLYTRSHLDFGLQKGRATILKRFRDAKKLSSNPCFNTRSTPIQTDVMFEQPPLTLAFTDGLGDYAACQDLLVQTLFDPAMGQCKCDKCTYAAAAQPQAPVDEFVAFAFYLERTVAIGMTSPISVADIDEKGKQVCAMKADALDREFKNIPNGNPNDLCLDLAYMSLHLQRGHGIKAGGDTKLTVVNKISNLELGWCLGAMQQTMAKLYPASSSST